MVTREDDFSSGVVHLHLRCHHTVFQLVKDTLCVQNCVLPALKLVYAQEVIFSIACNIYITISGLLCTCNTTSAAEVLE